MNPYQQLKKIYQRHLQLQYLQRVLMWDEAVMMPSGASEYRASAMATLNRSIHNLLVSKKTARLFTQVDHLDELSEWDIANFHWMKKKYLSATCLPAKLIEASTNANIRCEQAWRTLRPQNNWADLLPHLALSFKFTQEIALRRAEALMLDPYQTFLNEYVDGFTQPQIDQVFEQLKNVLPALIKKIMNKQKDIQLTLPNGTFTVEKQKNLGLKVMQALGFDFQRGRLDVSHHPFCSGGPDDVRMTTRYEGDDFLRSLYGICHETGHALYEQGLPSKWRNQPVGHIHSMAQHESQSLLIEMEVCRSLAFCEFLTPLLSQAFGEQSAFTAKNIFHLITSVEPSFIRVDADEVTYPLHVILRYEIEKQLFNGEITVKDLPAIWHEKMMAYFNLPTLGNDQNGVMQDVHWMSGAFGYFPSYTLGRLMAAQFFATFQQHQPDYQDQFKAGHFQSLKDWLEKNIYSRASSLPTQQLLVTVTGKPLDAAYFIHHIENRYL